MCSVLLSFLAKHIKNIQSVPLNFVFAKGAKLSFAAELASALARCEGVRKGREWQMEARDRVCLARS
jgi:hypothetical protein